MLWKQFESKIKQNRKQISAKDCGFALKHYKLQFNDKKKGLRCWLF